MTELDASTRQGTRTAAFFRVEGALVGRPAIAAAAYLAANAQGLGERFARLGNVALAAPLAWAGSVAAGSTARRATWMGVRGMSEDRLHVLAAEYYERQLLPSLREVGLELLSRSRKRGHYIVLVSDQIDLVVEPLVERVGAQELVCNRLEMRRGEATGRLEDPVVGGHLGGSWLRSFASGRGIDLEASFAYAASSGDGLLLSAIGQPCAVTPDPWLRRMAHDQQWPVVEG